MSLKYMTSAEVNRDLWDQCLLRSKNSLIYANSWYLDVVCPGWSGLVNEDYASIFPLPVKSKFGIHFLAHPLFAQQLGIFGNLKGVEVEDYLEQLKRFRFGVNLQLNPLGISETDRRFEPRINHLLELTDITEVRNAYNQNTKRNLKKADKEGLERFNSLTAGDFVSFKKSEGNSNLNEKAWKRMSELIDVLLNKNFGEIWAVKKGGELVSAVFFAKWNKRLTYLFSASSAQGKASRASFLIVDRAIEHYLPSYEVLDFEGSMDSNISRFFHGFGARPYHYYVYRSGLF
ncbi:MAG: GNAT family N-acetyltransferase [Vicingaceae bacterium]